MLSTSRLEILNFFTRIASLGVLAFIAVQLVGLREQQPLRPVTVGDAQSVRNDVTALRALEARIPLVRVGGDVNVTGTVDVDTVFRPVAVRADGFELPVTVTNLDLPVTVTNRVDVEVRNRELSGGVPVKITNFYDMPVRVR